MCILCTNTTVQHYFTILGNVVMNLSVKHLTRWLRMAAWLKSNLVGSAPNAIAVAVAMANRPQSMPPSCFCSGIIFTDEERTDLLSPYLFPHQQWSTPSRKYGLDHPRWLIRQSSGPGYNNGSLEVGPGEACLDCSLTAKECTGVPLTQGNCCFRSFCAKLMWR